MRKQLLIAAALCLVATEARGQIKPRISLDHDMVVPSPASIIKQKEPTDWRLFELKEKPYRHYIYLNFDGAHLTAGSQNSQQNVSELITVEQLDYPAMNFDGLGGREAGMTAIVNKLKEFYADFAVEFVTSRPASGDYTMAMIGGDGTDCKAEDATVGIAILDCTQTRTNDVVLVFANKNKMSAEEIAAVIAHELGHSFGLEHASSPEDIMYPELLPTTRGWKISAIADQQPACKRTTQDSHKILVDNLGPGPNDNISPKVWFKHPAEGAIMPPTFSFEVAAADDQRLHHLSIFIDGVWVAYLETAPFTYIATNLDPGEHVLAAEVADWLPNRTRLELKITVDKDCINKGTCNLGVTGFGGTCVRGGECGTGLCLTKEQAGQCSDVCSETEPTCPAGTTCINQGTEWICSPEAEGWQINRDSGSDGGCNISLAGTVDTALFLGVVLSSLLFLLAIRRPRRSHSRR